MLGFFPDGVLDIHFDTNGTVEELSVQTHKPTFANPSLQETSTGKVDLFTTLDALDQLVINLHRPNAPSNKLLDVINLQVFQSLIRFVLNTFQSTFRFLKMYSKRC